jgi:hypothetical protein
MMALPIERHHCYGAGEPRARQEVPLEHAHRTGLILGALIGLLVSGPAWAQTFFEVTPTASSAQERPAIAALPNLNQFLVVWQDFQAGVLFDISGQLVNGNGTITGSKIAISNATGDQLAPAVAYNPTTNQFLVVWQHDSQAASLMDIRGQLVNGNGTLSGSEIAISTTTSDTSNQTVPAVAYNSTTNQFLVVWQHDSQAASLMDIRGRLVDAAGTPIGSEISISPTAGDTSNQTVPGVAYNSANNQFLIVWQHDSLTGTLLDISGRLVDANGSFPGTAFTISNAAGDQTTPAVAYNATANQFLVGWQTLQGGFFDISGQLVNANGSLGTGPISISTAANHQTAPAVAYNATANQFLVVWEDLRGGSFTDIFAQRVAADGSLSEGNFEIRSTDPSSDRVAPQLSFNNLNANEFVVVWQDRQGGPTTDIVGQVTAGGGTATPPSVVVTAPNNIQTLTVGVAFMITWTASDTSGLIVSQEIRLSIDGGLTFPTVIANPPGSSNSFPWTPTSADVTTQGRIRVTATDNSVPTPATGRDASNANFAVAEPGAPGTAPIDGCMIATAAFGSPLAAEVETLRAFRDRYLIPHTAGRWAVAAYYRASPPAADLIRQHEPLRAVTRGLLWPVLWWAQMALVSPALAVTVAGGVGLIGLILPVYVIAIRRRHRNAGSPWPDS